MPAAVALTLVALLTGRGLQIGSELHLIASDAVERGGALPIRAHLYTELARPEGAELTAAAQVAVELRAGGRVLAAGRLRPSHAQTLEGALVLPGDFVGRAVLGAETELDGERVRSERTVEVVPGVAAGSAAGARALAPLQRFAAGPLQPAAEAGPPPSALALHIAGGACVPEHTCTLLVHVGEPAAAVRVIATPSVTPDAASARASAVTTGVVALRVVTHGPEAELRIAAERDGTVVATRAFRLEIALSAVALAELPRVLAAPAAPAIALQDDESGCIVDAFADGRWARTGSLRECRGREPLPFSPLTPGLWRLQVRRDPFGASSAAVATLYVREAGVTDAAVLSALAAAVRARAAADALASAVLAQPDDYIAAFADTAAYLLAALDGGVLALPEPVSGYPRALAQLEATRARVRSLALVVIALCAVTMGLLVLARGLSAAGEASRLLAEAGEEPARIDRQRLRMTLRVLASVSSLLVLFAAIAAYVIARSAAP